MIKVHAFFEDEETGESYGILKAVHVNPDKILRMEFYKAGADSYENEDGDEEDSPPHTEITFETESDDDPFCVKETPDQIVALIKAFRKGK